MGDGLVGCRSVGDLRPAASQPGVLAGAGSRLEGGAQRRPAAEGLDRALEPVDNNVVIAVVGGELMVKRILKSKNRLFLIPDNRRYEPVEVTEEMDVKIWGVVTNVIHSL